MSGISKEYESQLVDHDLYTYKHCENVGCLMKLFATWLQIPAETINEAYIAGTWHDIGKLWIPQQMLQKEDSLSRSEWEALKEHAYLGSFFLGGDTFAPAVSRYVLHHHERYDGQGYPSGLKKEEIPLVSRMLAVCDAFDAMISERPHRRPMTTEEALTELQKNIGSQFDPQVVRSFTVWIQENDKCKDAASSSCPIHPYRKGKQAQHVQPIDDEVEALLTELPHWFDEHERFTTN